MQWLLVCFFVIGLLCLIQGLRKSTVGTATRQQHYCARCGWTSERVQRCKFEEHHITKFAPMCFNCAIENDAIVVKTPRIAYDVKVYT